MGNIPNPISKVGTVPDQAKAEGVEFIGFDTYIVGLSTALPAQYQFFQRGTNKGSNYQNFELPAEKTVAYRFTHARVVWDLRFSTPANALAGEAYFENNSSIQYVIEDKSYSPIPVAVLSDANRVVSGGAYVLREKLTNKYQFKEPIEVGGEARVNFYINFASNLTTAATATTNPYLPGQTGGAISTTEGFSVRLELYGVKLRTIR